ncbi:S8 family serine peptidase [Lamprobacter modestohalophilus]|uniref:S8 family serine peptidase n=1 Tax=Lamprobacter modestohalophilus TaxID=1064514 RepID=UPI001907B458|nr:S8 family serine peptidase [Lamprobacter modestohalophilus]
MKACARATSLPLSCAALLLLMLGWSLASQSAPGFLGDHQKGPDATASVRQVKRPLPDQYIVLYKPEAVDPGRRRSAIQVQSAVGALNQGLASQYGGQIRAQWSRAVQGMAVRLNAAAAARLARDSRVLLVEEDGVVTASALQSPVTWGLDRIDQRNLPLNNSYAYTADGSTVTAYIIDTGIRTTHQEFGSRASWGTNTAGDGFDLDCDGHGTHVAGTVGGNTYGVAKGVSLVAVKVLDCDGFGSDSGVISGIEWVVTQVASAEHPGVINMSLGGGYSLALNRAVKSASDAGIPVVVAAGNENEDACTSSPASAPEAITVGASTSADHRSWFSNFGSCVDLFAPGSAITSATNASDTATGTWNGTSMASPHVAGAAALYLDAAYQNSGAIPTAADLAAQLLTNATPDQITDPAGSPNKLLYTTNDGNIRLQVAKAGTGSGRVESLPAGIDCGADCSQVFTQDTNVALYADPDAGDSFDGWSGAGCSGTGSCSLTMDASKIVTATFSTPPPEISSGEPIANLSGPTGSTQYFAVQVPAGATDLVISISGGTGDAYLYVRYGELPTAIAYDCRPYLPGNEETCTFPTPTSGTWYVRLHAWSSYSGVTLSADYRSQSVDYQLSVNKTGTGSGTVTSNPAGIACGNTCEGTFVDGTGIVLEAQPAVGSAFGGWSGACSGLGSCELTLENAVAVDAEFFRKSASSDPGQDVSLPSRGGWRAAVANADQRSSQSIEQKESLLSGPGVGELSTDAPDEETEFDMPMVHPDSPQPNVRDHQPQDVHETINIGEPLEVGEQRSSRKVDKTAEMIEIGKHIDVDAPPIASHAGIHSERQWIGEFRDVDEAPDHQTMHTPTASAKVRNIGAPLPANF